MENPTSRSVVMDTSSLRINVQRGTAVDLSRDGPDIGVEMTGENLGILTVTAKAHDDIAMCCGIPARYYRRMFALAPALLAANINHWFKAEPSRRLLKIDGSHLIAFQSSREWGRDATSKAACH